ncbi:MAG: DUF3857 domain-containing protein [Myxococcota bacterium]
MTVLSFCVALAAEPRFADLAPLTSPVEPFRAAAAGAPGVAGDGVRWLWRETRDRVDEAGNVERTVRRVYRIESAKAVRDYTSVDVRWDPEAEAKPTVDVRVVGAGGQVARLDANLLVVSEDADGPVMRAPRPGLEPGAIVEDVEVRRPISPLGLPPAGRLYASGLADGYDLVSVEAPAKALKTRALGGESATTKLAGGASRVTLLAPPAPRSPPPALEYATGATWTAVAGEYAERVDAAVADPALVEVAKGIVGDAKGDDAVAAIFGEMARVRTRFIRAKPAPRRAMEVWTTRDGDLLEVATLAVGLLRAAGFPAEVLLLRVGGPDLDPAFAGAELVNHVVVRAGDWIEDVSVDPWKEVLPNADVLDRRLLQTGARHVGEWLPAAAPSTMTIRERTTFDDAGSPVIRLEVTGTGAFHATGLVPTRLAPACRREATDARGTCGILGGLPDPGRPGQRTLLLDAGIRRLLEPWAFSADPVTQDVPVGRFRAEWTLEVALPDGYAPIEPPGDASFDVGDFRLRRVVTGGPGAFAVTVTVDSGDGLVTASEVSLLRTAVQRVAAPIDLTFASPAGRAFSAGRTGEGLRALAAAAEGKEPGAVAAYAEALVGLGFPEEALEVARAGMAPNPGEPRILAARAVALRASGEPLRERHAEVLAALLAGVKARPDRDDWWLHLAEVATFGAWNLRWGPGSDVALAKEAWQHLYVRRPNVVYARRLAAAHAAAGDWDGVTRVANATMEPGILLGASLILEDDATLVQRFAAADDKQRMAGVDLILSGGRADAFDRIRAMGGTEVPRRAKPAVDPAHLDRKNPAHLPARVVAALVAGDEEAWEEVTSRDAGERLTLEATYAAYRGEDPFDLGLTGVTMMADAPARVEGDRKRGWLVVMDSPFGEIPLYAVWERGAVRLRGGLTAACLPGVEALARAERGDLAGAETWMRWADAHTGKDRETSLFRALPAEPRTVAARAALLGATCEDAGAIDWLVHNSIPGKEALRYAAVARALTYSGRSAELADLVELVEDAGDLKVTLRLGAYVDAGDFARAEEVLAGMTDADQRCYGDSAIGLAALDWKRVTKAMASCPNHPQIAGLKNNAAWLSLYVPGHEAEALDLARKAVRGHGAEDGGPSRNTLATLLVATGATDEAWTLWREWRNTGHSPTMVPAWELVRARIAEEWGLKASAAAAYAVAEKSTEGGAVSVAELVKRWRGAAVGD